MTANQQTNPIPGTFAADQPMPATSPYPLYELYQYQIFSRASAKSAGLPASCTPHFNPAWPVKNWVALDVDDTDQNSFLTLKAVKQGDVSQVVLPAKFVPFLTQPGQAGTLNLPDEAASYPPYVVAPTSAYINNGGPINPEYLSNMFQAQDMAVALGVKDAPITEWQPTAGPGGFQVIYPADEKRRWYQFVDGFGQVQTVGLMLRAMNQNGVGATGQWAKDGKTWQWLPTHSAPVDPPHGAIFPMPMRKTLPEETIQPVSLGGPIMIINSKLPFGG